MSPPPHTHHVPTILFIATSNLHAFTLCAHYSTWCRRPPPCALSQEVSVGRYLDVEFFSWRLAACPRVWKQLWPKLFSHMPSVLLLLHLNLAPQGNEAPLFSANWPLRPNRSHTAPGVCDEHQQQGFQTDSMVCFPSFPSVPWVVSAVRGALLAYAVAKCLIKQEVMHRTAVWEKPLKSPLFLVKAD